MGLMGWWCVVVGGWCWCVVGLLGGPCSCLSAVLIRGEGGCRMKGEGRLGLWGMKGVGCGVLCGDGVGGLSNWSAAMVMVLVGDVGVLCVVDWGGGDVSGVGVWVAGGLG